MTIEHINEDDSSAINLQASQQFPVVTRRFRQLPKHVYEEGVEEVSKQALQDKSSAQLTVAPSSNIKCDISVSEPNKNTQDDGAIFYKQQVDDNTELISSTPITPTE